MMNIFTLGIVLTSLVTAGFFTPNPEKENPKEEAVIVKEGHRVVVVEYEKDDGNTKVSISPKDEKGYINAAKAKLSEKMKDMKGRVEEASSSVGDQAEEIHNKFSPTEIVCDAYGKCKRIIAGAVGKTKEAADRAYEAEEEANRLVGEAVGKVKDKAAGVSHHAFDKVQEAKENVRSSANDVSSKARDKFAEKTSKIKESVEELPERTRRRVEDAIEAANKVKEEAERDARIKMEGNKESVLKKAEEAEEWVENASEKAKQSAFRAKKEGRKGFNQIMRRARDFGVNTLDYVVWPSTGVLHLMGFSAAYGMCVWVTFASSYVLGGALPRQQFAMVQSKIYPVYFRAMAYCVGMALVGHLVSYGKRSGGMFQSFNLGAALVMTLVNLLYLEPRATKVMLERMKKEKEEGKGGGETGRRVVEKDSIAEIAGRGGGAVGSESEGRGAAAEIAGLTATLQRLNSHSSYLNVLTLTSLTWHLVHLGKCLHTG